MSEPENFLERWSRRKRAAADAPPPQKDEIAPPEKTDAPPSPATDVPKDPSDGEPFDLASLPSIESIGANTDVRAFLRPGVPPELTRAALRRAWSTDPAIRDFVGLVENGWDFNDPNAMAGFGTIGAGEVARLLSQAVGEALPEASGSSAEPPQAAVPRGDSEQSSTAEIASSERQENAAAPKPAAVQRSENDASQNDSGNQGKPPTS